jgi:hypothetical protein
LGDLERAVMQLIRARVPLTADAVRKLLARRLRDSTEVAGSPEKPVIHIHRVPVPGVLRKFMEFRTDKQNNPSEFSSPNSPSNH